MQLVFSSLGLVSYIIFFKNNFFVSATPVLTILCDPVYVGSRQIVEEKERELWGQKEPCVFT